MQPYRELEYYKGYRIQIVNDEDGPNPRQEFDNFGHIVCWHRNYNLGDRDHNGRQTEYYHQDPQAFQDWFMANKKDIPVILMLYLYEHGGITIRCSPFYDPWDSGPVGFIYLTREKILEEYGWKVLTKQRREKLESYLKSEVEVYDQYLTGDVWGYVVDTFIGETEEDGEPVDPEDYLETNDLWEDAYGHNSCWGFFGKKYCLEEAKIQIDAHIAYLEKKEAERVEKLDTNHQYLFIEREAVGL